MKHNNLSMPQKITDTFKLKGGEVPNEIDEVVKLVYDVSPDCDVITYGDCDNQASANILATASGRDYFLRAIMLTVAKDVTAVSNRTSILGYVKGTNRYLGYIRGITLTAQNQSVYIQYPTPIKIDRGTTITLNNSSGVANINASCILFGYYVD